MNLETKINMLIHPQFDPIAFSVGPVSVHWYGLMYLVGFALFWFLGSYRAKKDDWRGVTPEAVEELEKILLRYGYNKTQSKRGSSHYIFRKGQSKIVIPKHKPILKVHIALVRNAVEEEEKK